MIIFKYLQVILMSSQKLGHGARPLYVENGSALKRTPLHPHTRPSSRKINHNADPQTFQTYVQAFIEEFVAPLGIRSNSWARDEKTEAERQDM